MTGKTNISMTIPNMETIPEEIWKWFEENGDHEGGNMAGNANITKSKEILKQFVKKYKNHLLWWPWGVGRWLSMQILLILNKYGNNPWRNMKVIWRK